MFSISEKKFLLCIVYLSIIACLSLLFITAFIPISYIQENTVSNVYACAYDVAISEREKAHEKAVDVEFEINEANMVNIEIPTYTYAKTYEDGGLITDTTSDCYEWISQCEIDEAGHYRYGEYYAVAMGNYFDEVGSKYKVTLDTGRTFYVIKCDVKQDQHTTNQMIDSSGAILEFIIDTETASNYYGVGSNGYILNGSFNNHENFNGNVVKIEMIEEV